ncbi:hypothetical protein AB0D10_24375 [Kitasatospora sp. NPDC048545]|uniref:hypothetical protein n=1 Tax=Kitasatospora sp. NPDC048545 TaxID=3157208 RepID=UPI0033EA194A
MPRRRGRALWVSVATGGVGLLCIAVGFAVIDSRLNTGDWQQGTVDPARLTGHRMVRHSGPGAPDVPGKPVGAGALLSRGSLLAIGGLIASLVIATRRQPVTARRRPAADPTVDGPTAR